MFYIYGLKSKKDYNLYIGFTSDLRSRLEEHNSGLNRSTKTRRPFNLIYYEAYKDKGDAMKREIMLKKHGVAFGGLKRRVATSLKFN